MNGQRNTGFIVGAALVFMLLAGLVVVILFGGQTHTATPKATTSASVLPLDWPDEPERSGGDTQAPSECGVVPPASDQPGAQFVQDWLTVNNGVRVPTALGQGPTVLAPVPHCFAHSNVGALLAAGSWTILATSGVEAARVYEHYVYPDRVGQAAIAQMKQDSVGLSSPVELRGWRLEPIDSEMVVAHVAYSLVNQPSSISSVQLTLRWAGDWKVVFPDGGQFVIQPVTSLENEGFNRW